MCEAARLKWEPPSLYDRCCRQVARSWSCCQGYVATLPADVLFDISFKLYQTAQWTELNTILGSLPLMCKLLMGSSKRIKLHQIFQVLMDEKELGVCENLVQQYISLCSDDKDMAESHQAHSQWMEVFESKPTETDLVESGVALGLFMREAAWYAPSQSVLKLALHICENSTNETLQLSYIEVGALYLNTLNSNCVYSESKDLLDRLLSEAEQLESNRRSAQGLAALYVEASVHHFTMNKYEEAYKYCTQACQVLPRGAPPRVKLDVLRQCVKSSILRREFKRGNFFIRRAVQYAEKKFGLTHPRYSDVLLDYGFYLLNIDSTDAAVQVYQKALDIRKSVFGGNNLKVACAHEDLAYATYVQQYSAGGFSTSRDHANSAIKILEHLLPKDHLLLASAKRVLALILEEIAIDCTDPTKERELLLKAEELHLHSLTLAQSAYGEFNIQTAKHYGNLGRLYQSLRFFQKAEAMHLRAIEIKERLLGEHDYEVALSVGHLASLYNYDMEKYNEAEELYQRSIQIGKRLFGEGYSGLEYDYRGLLRLYARTDNMSKAYEYSAIFNEWLSLRQQMQLKPSNPFNLHEAQTEPAAADVEMLCADSLLGIKS